MLMLSSVYVIPCVSIMTYHDQQPAAQSDEPNVNQKRLAANTKKGQAEVSGLKKIVHMIIKRQLDPAIIFSFSKKVRCCCRVCNRTACTHSLYLLIYIHASFHVSCRCYALSRGDAS